MIAALLATVVLGSSAFAPGGYGWGTAHPSKFHNGGDPSGGVDHIHWSGWGGSVAHGRGLNPIFEPQGGYFPREARILLRAQKIGTCPDGTGPAYTRLSIRVPQWPGGPRGPWWRWADADEICDQNGTGDEGSPPGSCGHVGHSGYGVGSVFGIIAYRVRCTTARRLAGELAHAGCTASGCRRNLAGLACRLERLQRSETTPFGNHPAQRVACTRGSANFTGWLARRRA